MAVDLFSMVLSPFISWGVNRLLDTVVNCSSCGKEHVHEISNYEINNQYCSKCGNQLDQYVNASQHTINRNRSVVGAYISNMHWPGWRDEFKLYYDLDVINSKYEPVVVKLMLSKFNDSQFHEFEFVKKPTYENCRWTDTWITIPRSAFPQEPQIVAVDLLVYNTWGDFLCEKRNLMEYGMKKDSDCFLTTIACTLKGLPDNCEVLENNRVYRDMYLSKMLIEFDEFILDYKQLSFALICDSQKYYKKVLPKYFESHLINASAKINNGDFEGATLIFRDLLIKIEHEYKGKMNLQNISNLISRLDRISTGHNTQYSQ